MHVAVKNTFKSSRLKGTHFRPKNQLAPKFIYSINTRIIMTYPQKKINIHKNSTTYSPPENTDFFIKP